MKSRFGEDVAITPGKSGQFDVLIDGELIFSKSETGRFPIENEVEERFTALKEGRDLPPLAQSKPGLAAKVLGKIRR